MPQPPTSLNPAIAPNDTAPQHGPRPLPLFLDMLWRETENDPELRQLSLAGLRRFQETEREVRKIIAPEYCAADRALLLRVGTCSNKPSRGRTPIVLVPSLINPPHVLDLAPDNSLGHFLAQRGHDVWLVDWGAVEPAHRDIGLAEHVEHYLLPLLDNLPTPPVLVGYCLGGSLCLGAAAAARAAALVTIAAPWHFDRYDPADTRSIAGLWDQSRALCETLGYVPMEALQSGFWALDAARTVRKYAEFAGMADGSDAAKTFIALEDWANEGEPLTLAAGRDLFEQFYGANMTGNDRWKVAGHVQDWRTPPCPALSIRSRTDRIVPHAASLRFADDMLLDLGHVGMVVSRRAPDLLWHPLAEWIERNIGQ